jgi:hypothetical protein
MTYASSKKNSQTDSPAYQPATITGPGQSQTSPKDVQAKVERYKN